MPESKQTSFRKAFDAAKKSVSIDPNIRGSCYHLASVSTLLGETNQAITSLEAAIKADRMYCLVVDQDKDFDPGAEVLNLHLRLKKEAKTDADTRLGAVRGELADRKFGWEYEANRQFVGEEEPSLEKEIRTLITKAEHLIGNATYFDYLDALVPLEEASKLIDKQKQNESTRRELQIQIETSYKQLSAAARELQYEDELELKQQIDLCLKDAQYFSSDGSLISYHQAQNCLNRGFNSNRNPKTASKLTSGNKKGGGG